jgi:hypothetical protein
MVLLCPVPSPTLTRQPGPEDGNGALDVDEMERAMDVFKDGDTKELMEHVGIDAAALRNAIRVADIDGLL